MSSPSAPDPLRAVDLLREEISGANGLPGDVARLIRAIDTLIYSFHFVDTDSASVTETDATAPRPDYQRVYDAIKLRYPTLGHYWLALHPVMQEGMEGELAVGDAIDDLSDILLELNEVRWFSEHVGRKSALAVLRNGYDMHLWMHFHSLRQYLEEVKRDD